MPIDDGKLTVSMGRLRYIRLSGDIIVKILTGAAFMDRIVTPLPPDTRYIRSGVDATGTLLLIIESESFELLHDGDEIPFHGHLTFQKASWGGGDGKTN